MSEPNNPYSPVGSEKRFGIATLFVHEFSVFTVILINALALFLDAFPEIHSRTGPLLGWVDFFCLVFFIVELLFKSRGFREFSEYWKGGWNKVDFIVIIASLPVLIGPLIAHQLDDLAILLLLRLGRLLRFTMAIRYIPNATRILKGVARAMKASVGVLLILFVVNVILGLGATLLFGKIPEAHQYFGDPFRSMYSMFKVFTVEGWYEIPEQMAWLGVSQEVLIGMRAYFTFAVLMGGLIGLSIANAVFVDEMMADNTDQVEQDVKELREELRNFHAEYRRDRLGNNNGEGDSSS